MEDDAHIFVTTMHHVASDAWSLYVFRRDLERMYDAYSRGAEPDLPELPLQYADFAVWQRGAIEEQRLQELLAYWREKLDGVTPLELPTDRPRPVVPTFRGNQHVFELQEEVVDQLKSLGSACQTTLHMTLLAAFQVLLARFSRQDDIAVATPIAGRITRSWKTRSAVSPTRW